LFNSVFSKLRLKNTHDSEKFQVAAHRGFQEAVEFKRTERMLTRDKLARKLGIGTPKLSQIMSGNRDPDFRFLKAVHKANIDAEFLLQHA